jgi:hypothetical protein
VNVIRLGGDFDGDYDYDSKGAFWKDKITVLCFVWETVVFYAVELKIKGFFFYKNEKLFIYLWRSFGFEITTNES